MHVALQQQKLWYDRGPGWLISKPSRFPACSGVKNLSANAGEMSSIPGLGRTPGGGHGYPLYSCLGNPKDREAWQATVHGVAKNRTRLSNRTTTTTSTFLQIRLYGAPRRLFKSPFSLLTSLPAWTANRHLNSILMYVPSCCLPHLEGTAWGRLTLGTGQNISRTPAMSQRALCRCFNSSPSSLLGLPGSERI